MTAALHLLVALLGAAALAGCSGADPGAPQAASADAQREVGDRCARSAQLVTGTRDGALYRSIAPFEHHDVERSHLFRFSCSLQELGADAQARIVARRAPDDYFVPFNAQTRERDELLLHGFGEKAGAPFGGYVALLDAHTLAQRWRTPLYDEEPAAQWSWPGMVTAHGNGWLYAVYGNRFYKLDPADGRVLAERALPEGPWGAVYNGFDLLPDGRLVTKNMESPFCPLSVINALVPYSIANELLRRAAVAQTFGGLACHLLLNQVPSTLVVLEPERLEIVQQFALPEPMAGRVTVRSHDGRAYVYVPGRAQLYRYRYDGAQLSLDASWGPVPYVLDGQGPAAAANFLGDFVILQNTGYLRAGSLIAIDIRDTGRQFRIDPFALLPGVPLGPSFVLSQPSVDEDNGIVVALDTLALQIGAIRFDPAQGFETLWRRPTVSIAYSALTGPPQQRQIVVPDQLQLGPVTGDPLAGLAQDRVLWLDLFTGAEIATSPGLDLLPAPGNIVTPGFDGRFYYAGASGGLHELSPERAGD